MVSRPVARVRTPASRAAASSGGGSSSGWGSSSGGMTAAQQATAAKQAANAAIVRASIAAKSGWSTGWTTGWTTPSYQQHINHFWSPQAYANAIQDKMKTWGQLQDQAAANAFMQANPHLFWWGWSTWWTPQNNVWNQNIFTWQNNISTTPNNQVTQRKQVNQQINSLMNWNQKISENDITSALSWLSGGINDFYKNTVLRNIMKQTGASTLAEAVDKINAGRWITDQQLQTPKDNQIEMKDQTLTSDVPAVQDFYDMAQEQRDVVQDTNQQFDRQLMTNADNLANQIQQSFWQQADIIRRRAELAAETFNNMNARLADLAQKTNEYHDAGVSQRAGALAQRMAAEGLLSGDQAQALSATLISDQTSIANLEKMKIGREIAEMQIQVMREFDAQRDAIMQQEWVNENAKLQAVEGLNRYYADIIKRFQDFTNQNLQQFNAQTIAPTQSVAMWAAGGLANAEASRKQFSTSPQEIYTNADVRFSELYKKIRDDQNLSGLLPYALEYMGRIKNTWGFLAKDIATQFSEIVAQARQAQIADAQRMG
jgi:hypothetical protein